MFRKLLISIFLATGSIAAAEDEWVSVPRPERIIHQLEEEEDRTIWVVFAKRFESEHVLIRFPEDPTYKRFDGQFIATATHLGIGEMTLQVSKKSEPSLERMTHTKEISYLDAEKGIWIYEKHVETEQHRYLLRVSHPSDSATLFRKFTDSFEIERSSDFRR